jgi:hypothetical protein
MLKPVVPLIVVVLLGSVAWAGPFSAGVHQVDGGSAAALPCTLTNEMPNGAWGLTVNNSGLNPAVFANPAETASNQAQIINLGASSTSTTLARSPASERFRGVDFFPAPEPSTIALMGLGALALLNVRRFWRSGRR